MRTLSSDNKDIADAADGTRYTGECAEVVMKCEVGGVRGNGGKMPTSTVVDDP